MNPIDIVILVSSVAAVVGVIALAVIRKKQGKSLGCDCSSCHKNCPNRREKQEIKK